MSINLSAVQAIAPTTTDPNDFTFGSDAPSAAVAAAYRTHGVVVIKNLTSADALTELRLAFSAMIHAALGDGGAPDDTPAALDAAYAELADRKPATAKALKGLGKDIPAFHKAITLPEIESLVSTVMGSSFFQINYDQCLFRLDRPNEDLAAFNWHQDYPYNMMSQNAVTGWFPLVDIEEGMGFLKAIPGTHDQILRIAFAEQTGQAFRIHNSFSIDDLDRVGPLLDERSMPIGPVGPGDAVFFHCLLLHSSGKNRSNRSRWVINPRYGDLTDPAMVARDWRTARAKNPFLFTDLHKDLTVRL